MSPKTKKRALEVEDAIRAIYAGSVEGGPQGALKAQVKRARVELSRRKAGQFAKRLLSSLSTNRDEVVSLEALVVLGFAHPDVMRKNHVALNHEGRRLGALLERAGRTERAREIFEMLCERTPTDRTMELELAGVMRRSGNTDELVERYLGRAQHHMKRKEMEEALPWLQEVLALDRSRKDVVRMIRDVRHHHANKIQSAKSNRRFLGAFLILATVFGLLGYREWNIHQQYMKFEQAEMGNLSSMAARMGVLEEMRDSHKVWLGRNRVDKEIAGLKAEESRVRKEAAEKVEAENRALALAIEKADNARQEGLEAADRGQLQSALEHFERALEVAPKGWQHKRSLEKDVEAIRSLENAR